MFQPEGNNSVGAGHAFRCKVFKKPRPCHLCHQPIFNQGSCCRGKYLNTLIHFILLSVFFLFLPFTWTILHLDTPHSYFPHFICHFFHFHGHISLQTAHQAILKCKFGHNISENFTYKYLHWPLITSSA